MKDGSSSLSCFCKEIWTLGVGCLHDVSTCTRMPLFSHRQEVNLKTFNISFYIFVKFIMIFYSNNLRGVRGVPSGNDYHSKLENDYV